MQSQIHSIMLEVAEVNRLNGWHDESRTFGEDVALLHSEVSEMLEAYRKNDTANLYEEAADVFIRLLDTWFRLGKSGDDLVDEVMSKLAKNRTRGYRHGGKVI